MTNREWLDGLSKGTTQEYLDALRAWLEQEHQEAPAPAEEKRTHKLQPGDVVRDIRTDKAVVVTCSYNMEPTVFVIDEDGCSGLISADTIVYTGVHLSALENVLQELKNANENARG